ncbi:tyrosine-type recombinase/integrase [Aestuariivirga sp.]|uniref:tyrosine-type recombinase/integrase n=1 Tax=Aestuariivirga sp. TaxID=2650926 RepID=UPI00391B1518
MKEAVAQKAKCDALFALSIDKAKKAAEGRTDKVEHVERLALALRQSSVWGEDPDTGEALVSIDPQEGEAALQNIETPLRPFFLDVANGREVKRLSAFVEPWMASIGHLAPNTLLERKSVIEKLLKWSGDNGVLNVSRFSRDHAKAFTATLGKEPATVSKALQAPSSLWKYMKDEGVQVDPDIWKYLAPKKPRREKNEDLERPFTHAELKVLMSGPARRDLKDAMTISLYTGMRLSELGYLRVEHVDLTKKTLLVPGGKNHNAFRLIPLHPKLASLLRSRMEDKEPRVFIMHELGDEGLKHGRKRSAKLSQAFTRYRESLGITEEREGKRRSLVNFHSFRRTADTAMIEHHPPIAPHVIDAFFGWSDQGKMRNRYAVGAELMAQMRKALAALEWDL